MRPAPSPIPVRIGGFGGIDGLAAYIAHHAVEAIVDATHPFAARISAHAAAACARHGIPLATYTRPAWTPGPGDHWTDVEDLPAAADALGETPVRVFLTTGRLGLAAFKAAPQHSYLVRTIDPSDEGDRPPHCRTIQARGPFPAEAEVALLDAERIDVLVTKNSGAAASAGKITAARRLGLPVVMIRRPASPTGLVLTDLAAVGRWIDDQAPAP